MKVHVKWGKEKYSIDVDKGESPLLFKGQLFALTGVAPERQKIIFKGKALQDDSWNGFQATDGALLMMLGSADAVPQAPTGRGEGMDTSDSDRPQFRLPAGLTNLGNTCYMNATLQCLKTVPELGTALANFSEARSGTTEQQRSAEMVTQAVKNLFGEMNRSPEREIKPLFMVTVLHAVFPQFAEKDDDGRPKQQDANECWYELVKLMKMMLNAPQPSLADPTDLAKSDASAAGADATGAISGGSNANGATGGASGSAARDVISQYFEGEFRVEMKCKEAESEPKIVSTEKFTQLRCYIQDAKYIHSGLLAGMTGELEKHSPTLNRNAVYEKTSLITRLPAYVTIQLMRFFYKGNVQVNAKMLKDVKFGLNLDLYDLCSPELKEKLLPMRSRFKQYEDRIAESKVKLEDELEKSGERRTVPYWFPDDPGSNNSGFYELQAVLTHKGRYSNSGHYVAWVRNLSKDRTDKKSLEPDWLMCDDEHVTPVTDEDILKLSGGGDWHCAYVLLYGPKVLREEGKGEKME